MPEISPPELRRYRSGLTDSSRWAGFVFRPGDIVISAPSKCGTTWLQMICALLVFQTPDLQAPLTTLSPWLDMRLRPLPEVLRILEEQQHRRFIKTHTPLDGLPHDPAVTYLTIGRDPRDVAPSMDAHRRNLDTGHINELLDPAHPPQARPATAASPTPRERVLDWFLDARPATTHLDSLRAMINHLSQAWDLRDAPHTVLLHYADLARDLGAQMRALADRLAISVPEQRWPSLIRAATFEQMRSRAVAVLPDEGLRLFKDHQAFFAHGPDRTINTVLTTGDLERYDALVQTLAPVDMLDWLHRGWAASP
ncbi:sulfotransferase domain-containing protein [Actinocorallia libanotica]|uniref:Glycolipid sulfotransferase n=1 Tax=Actinocorallia libanotica TaxID=46162 RepID=A0ABP4BYW7_9ACTN